MMAVVSRVPHCRPQLLPMELGTDMQHGQSKGPCLHRRQSTMEVLPDGGDAPPRVSGTLIEAFQQANRHANRVPVSVPFNREAHLVPCARAAVGPQRTEQE